MNFFFKIIPTSFYNLHLETSGLRYESGVDVLLILDRSSSMNAPMDNGKSRWANTQEAAVSFVSNFLSHKESKNRMSLVFFDDNAIRRPNNFLGVNDSATHTGQLSKYGTQKSKLYFETLINNWFTNGNTNYDNAFKSALDTINTITDDERPLYVVFMTDGAPNSTRQETPPRYYDGVDEMNQIKAKGATVFAVAVDIANDSEAAVEDPFARFVAPLATEPEYAINLGKGADIKTVFDNISGHILMSGTEGVVTDYINTEYFDIVDNEDWYTLTNSDGEVTKVVEENGRLKVEWKVGDISTEPKKLEIFIKLKDSVTTIGKLSTNDGAVLNYVDLEGLDKEVPFPDAFVIRSSDFSADDGHITKPYAESTSVDEIKNAIKVLDVHGMETEDFEITLDENDIPTGFIDGEFEVPVKVIYTNGLTEDVIVTVTVLPEIIDQTENPNVPTPDGYHRVTFVKGDGIDSVEKKVYDVRENSVLPAAKFPGYVVSEGYENPYWTPGQDLAIVENTEFIVTATAVPYNEVYDVEGGSITKPYGEATSLLDISNQVTVTDIEGNLYDLETPYIVELKDGVVLPDGYTPGNYDVPVYVVYPDGTKDETIVKVTVLEEIIDQTENPDEPTPEGYYRVTFVKGDGIDSIGNKVYDVRENSVLPADKFPVYGVSEGYENPYWTPEQDLAIVENTVFEVSATAVPHNEIYDAEGGSITKPFGVETTPEEISKKATVTDKEGNPYDLDIPYKVEVKDGVILPDGKTPGTHEVPVNVIYPDGTIDEAIVTVIVLEEIIDQSKNPEVPTPDGYYRVTFAKGDGVGSIGYRVYDVRENSVLPVKNFPGYQVSNGYENPYWTPEQNIAIVETTEFIVAATAIPLNEVYDAKGGSITKPYGEATTPEDINNQVVVKDKDGNPYNLDTPYTVEIKDGVRLPDGKTPGIYEVPVYVVYPDGTKDEAIVTVTVLEEIINQTENPDVPTPDGYYRVTFVKGDGIYSVETKVYDVRENSKLPADKFPGYVVSEGYENPYWSPAQDIAIVENTEFKVLSTRILYSAIYDPKGKDITTDLNVVPDAKDGILNKELLPEGTKFEWKETPDVSKPGTTTGTIVVTYPDGSKDKVVVYITVRDTVTPPNVTLPSTGISNTIPKFGLSSILVGLYLLLKAKRRNEKY